MTSTAVKALTATTLFALIATVLVSSTPAYAINGHGVSYGPEFGGGSLVQYSDGLQINGKSIDISKYSQTISTQNLYINDTSDISLKIYHHDGSQNIQHVIVFMNLHGNNPQSYQSNTRIEFDKTNGVSVVDPNNVFKSVTAKVTYGKNYMYLSFKIVAKNPMNTTDLIVRAWDRNLSSSQVIILNAVKIGYMPVTFSSMAQ
ncbi:MAG: hypothetical protein KGH87_07820 [Thaumarchaeota archaeon]|nr:hypothetical protein [Nitrososphaerota archaeon]MDE1839810.1 hypothetical protein [Nitrososphaerota archaeon]